MSRGPQVRSARVLCFELASLGAMMGSVAEKLTDSILTRWSTRVDGPSSVDLQLDSRTCYAWFNVEMWPCPAHGSRVGMRATCPVGLTLIGDRVRMW